MPDSITNAAAQPGTTQPTLAIQDLLTVAQLIQLSTNRGTWRAEELSTVGSLYDKLLAFLEASGAITKAPAPGATAPAEHAPAPAEEEAPQADQENTNA
jgi:hypothetical protein